MDMTEQESYDSLMAKYIAAVNTNAILSAALESIRKGHHDPMPTRQLYAIGSDVQKVDSWWQDYYTSNDTRHKQIAAEALNAAGGSIHLAEQRIVTPMTNALEKMVTPYISQEHFDRAFPDVVVNHRDLKKSITKSVTDLMESAKGYAKSAHDDGRHGLEESCATELNRREMIKAISSLREAVIKDHEDVLCARIKAADDASASQDYMLDSDDCISVIRGTWKGPMQNDKPERPQDPPAGSGGWKQHAIEMEHQRDHYRERAQTMHEHQQGQVWYWQNDGQDDLKSMVNSLPVVIRADQLQALLAGEVASHYYPSEWIKFLHYPDCWDTAAYPTLQSAIHEALAWSGCSTCKAQAHVECATQPQAQGFCDGCGIPVGDVHMSTCPTKEWPARVQPQARGEVVSGFSLAAIGRKHWGNPIPQEWYKAARELLEVARHQATEPQSQDEVNALREALVYVAHAGHSTKQHMLPTGVMLLDNDGVVVRVPDGPQVWGGRVPDYEKKRLTSCAKATEPQAISDYAQAAIALNDAWLHHTGCEPSESVLAQAIDRAANLLLGVGHSDDDGFARYFSCYQGCGIEMITRERFETTPAEYRFKLYTKPQGDSIPTAAQLMNAAGHASARGHVAGTSNWAAAAQAYLLWNASQEASTQ